MVCAGRSTTLESDHILILDVLAESRASRRFVRDNGRSTTLFEWYVSHVLEEARPSSQNAGEVMPVRVRVPECTGEGSWTYVVFVKVCEFSPY